MATDTTVDGRKSRALLWLAKRHAGARGNAARRLLNEATTHTRIVAAFAVLHRTTIAKMRRAQLGTQKK